MVINLMPQKTRTKTNNYGKISYDSKIYSTSPRYAGKEVWVKSTAHEIIILDEDYRLIQRHDRLYGKQKESMKWAPYLNLMARRPTALKYTGFFKELPVKLQEYFDKCEYQQKKTALRILSRMVRETDINTA